MAESKKVIMKRGELPRENTLRSLPEERASAELEFSEDEMSLLEEGRAQTDCKETDVRFAEDTMMSANWANESFLSNIASYNSATDELRLREENEEYINEKTIQVRREDERKPMDGHRRKLTDMKITFDNLVDDVKDLFKNNDEEHNENTSTRRISSKVSVGSLDILPKQYHIEKRQIPRGPLLDRVLNSIGIIRSEYGSQDHTVDSFLQTYLQWTFHASFVTLFLSTFFIFMMLILFFSGFIALAGYLKPTCINPAITSFHDIHALSWTTFTTVGYGNIYPSLSSQEEEKGYCGFITFLTCVEAFIGVLYAGFCGAIIFGKVLRIQSQAQVTFSDILVVKFGQGATNRLRCETDASENDKIPCPTLEFRIVNRLYNKAGCEIIDASLNCVVINTDTDSLTRISSFTNLGEGTNEVNYTFAKLDIDISHHPFFKRVWTAKTVLSQDSPILQPWARRLVRKNGGYWPPELNHYEGVKRAIKFDEIVVNFSGTSNISAASVYAQKIYEDFDISIGYQFVNLVYKSNISKRMMLDMDMINDVIEQEGGGGEPMDDRGTARI